MRVVALGEVANTAIKLFFETEDLDGTSRESEEAFERQNGLTIKERDAVCDDRWENA